MAYKYLVIVESPTKAKTIDKYLGRNYRVVASKGHLRDLPKSRMGIDVENDYEPDYINIRGKGDLIKELRKDAKKAEKVFILSGRHGSFCSFLCKINKRICFLVKKVEMISDNL